MASPKAKFIADENGSETTAFVLWVPVFFLVLFFSLDVTLSMVAHSRMWDVARDTVRQMSLGIVDASGAVSYAQSADYLLGATPAVTAGNSGTEVWVDIKLPISSVTFFDFIGVAGSGVMTARATMIQEPS
ncbi:TadE/TadG family type IV pilus assembly protein [Oceanibium sediminis]|uniref:TadE/TadG family type IV pilus assembly protein n=1 Tax=Oceanibium sediminis TaxID=2026339 RepID=UPI001300A136|nr:TadE/TadG family type IV pilus assembly protein [Oceanibium sediminis]